MSLLADHWFVLWDFTAHILPLILPALQAVEAKVAGVVTLWNSYKAGMT